MAEVPDNFARFFWDCDLAALTWAQHRRFIAERILNLGDDAALDWLRARLTRAELADLVRTSRRLDPRTRNYWAWVLDGNATARPSA